MKVHDDIESVTDVYLAGGLEENERRAVEEHATGCPTCASILDDARDFHGWVTGLSMTGAPPTGLEDRIIANLRAASPRSRRWPRAPKLIKFLAGAAAVFALIVVGGLFSNQKFPGSAVASGALLYDENTGHDVKFLKHSPELDGYAGDTTTEGEIMSGWGYEASGYAALPGRSGFEAAKSGVLKDRDNALAAQWGATPSDKNLVRSTRGVQGGGAKPAATPPVADAAAPAEDRRKSYSDFLESESEKNVGKARHKEQSERMNAEQDRQYQEQEVQREFSNRKIIRNADLHLEVEAYHAAYAKVTEITRAKKGFVAGASTTLLANGKIRATVTLRIPPEKFEETLAELGKLGIVRHQAISTSDVTKQYQDLESRQKSKETLVERLKKVLLEGKGTVKELMEVEVQMGATIEQIESIKGELKYYDNLVGLSTIAMQIFEKDLGVPFEYIQTLQSVISVTAYDPDTAYAGAQKVIRDAEGQVVESRMTRANADSATGFVRAKVDAEKFPGVREALKKLGQRVDRDTVNQQQTGRGGQGEAGPGADVKKEQAVIDFTVNMPPIVVTKQAKITLETRDARAVYEEARREIAAAKEGKIIGGSLTDRTDGASAFVRGQAASDAFHALVEKLKSLGTVKSATVEQIVQGGAESPEPPLLREQGEILLDLKTPPPVLTEEHGLGRAIRETFAKSIAGILWSLEKLTVGIALAGPWILLAGLLILVWRRSRRARKGQVPAP